MRDRYAFTAPMRPFLPKGLQKLSRSCELIRRSATDKLAIFIGSTGKGACQFAANVGPAV